MESHWIFDGYNVMYSLKIISDANFECSRDAFISFVSAFQSIGDKKITIVFDGRASNRCEESCAAVYDRCLNVIYSKNNLNADGLIIRLVQNAKVGFRKNITVVTADGPLRYTILELGSVVITPAAFFAEYNAYGVNKLHKSKCREPFNTPFNELL